MQIAHIRMPKSLGDKTIMILMNEEDRRPPFLKSKDSNGHKNYDILILTEGIPEILYKKKQNNKLVDCEKSDEKALKYFRVLVKRTDNNVTYRWDLCATNMTILTDMIKKFESNGGNSTKTQFKLIFKHDGAITTIEDSYFIATRRNTPKSKNSTEKTSDHDLAKLWDDQK